MPDLHLVINDVALSDAITEQILSSNFDVVCKSSKLSTALTSPETVGIIFDESATDAKNLEDLADYAGSRRVPIFLLGKFSDGISKDYVAEIFVKPFRLGHLLSRLQFHIEIAPRLRSVALTFGPYRLEPQNRQVVRTDNGDIIRLTEKETGLLEFLGQSETPTKREDLLIAVWGYDARIDTHTLETHIYQLRRKLDPDGRINVLINEGGGYILRREL